MKSIDSCYSARIIKGGAMLADTKILLANWDVHASVEQNIERIYRYNLLAKATRSRVKDVVTIFRQRYLQEPSVTRTLVVLARNRFPSAAARERLIPHPTPLPLGERVRVKGKSQYPILSRDREGAVPPGSLCSPLADFDAHWRAEGVSPPVTASEERQPPGSVSGKRQLSD